MKLTYLPAVLGLVTSIFIVTILCEDLPELVVTNTQDGDVVALDLSSTDSDTLVEELKVIPPLSTIILRVTAVPLSTAFLLYQAHAFTYNVTMSYEDALTPGRHVNGTDVGLVRALTGTVSQVFVHNFNVDDNITVLVVAQAHTAKDPVPGGCNMEFPVEVSPYLEVRYTNSLVSVRSQLASPPAPLPCTAPLSYDVYHLFLEERDFEAASYFSGIRRMLTVTRIRENGRKVPEPLGLPAIQRVFSAYPGTGSVYAVVASFHFEEINTFAAYVPAFTYACSSMNWTDTCEVLTSTFSKLLCAVVFFLGLFVCFAGHHFFKTEMFIFGFLSGALLSYVLVAVPGMFDHAAHLAVAVLMGIICGTFWLALWWFYALPAVSTVLVSLSLGYLVAAIAFFAGAADFPIFQNDINFWTTFLCVVLTVPLLLVVFGHWANIMACSVLGAFAIIAPVDHYIGSNLKYIIVNTVRRATDADFRTAVIDPPFQTRDICLVASWLVCAVAGAGVQLYLQRNKPPFPPPPAGVVRDREELLSHERRPLLGRSQPVHSYAAVGGQDDVFEPTPGPSSAQ